MFDSAIYGQSLLITENLTEVFKVNNLYIFNIDFQNSYRINKIKIIFDEKSKKQQCYKMRVNICVPELNTVAEKSLPKMNLLHT